MELYTKTFKSKIENRFNLKYKFMKVNIENNLDNLVNKIGTAKYFYVAKLMHTMDIKNRIDFSYLGLPEGTLKPLRALFIKQGIIGKFKLKGDGTKTYYLNPYYAHMGKTISKELFNIFDEINKHKIY